MSHTELRKEIRTGLSLHRDAFELCAGRASTREEQRAGVAVDELPVRSPLHQYARRGGGRNQHEVVRIGIEHRDGTRTCEEEVQVIREDPLRVNHVIATVNEN